METKWCSEHTQYFGGSQSLMRDTTIHSDVGFLGKYSPQLRIGNMQSMIFKPEDVGPRHFSPKEQDWLAKAQFVCASISRTCPKHQLSSYSTVYVTVSTRTHMCIGGTVLIWCCRMIKRPTMEV